MLAVLEACGFGEPEAFTCLVFSSLENGLAHCKQLFGFEPDEIREGEDDELTAYRWAIEADESYEHDYVTDPNSIISKVANDLIRDFDGSIFAFDLVEVEEGKPFVRWVS